MPASHFWVSQKRDHAFYSCQSLLKSNIPASHREPGTSVQAWVADRGNCMQKTPAANQGEGYCERYFRACWFVPILLFASEITGSASSAALILIFYIFSRADARAITCAQQTCISIESFWRSLGLFIPRKWQTWNIHFLSLYLEVRKLPYPLQRKVLVCLDTENTSSEMPYRFLWTGPDLPGRWAGAQHKHVHQSLCIWLYAAFISHYCLSSFSSEIEELQNQIL